QLRRSGMGRYGHGRSRVERSADAGQSVRDHSAGPGRNSRRDRWTDFVPVHALRGFHYWRNLQCQRRSGAGWVERALSRSRGRGRPRHTASHPELPQMMIQMLVRAASPGLRRKRAKKRMRMPRALRFSALMELAHFQFELLLFSLKIARIRHRELLVRRVVLPEG